MKTFYSPRNNPRVIIIQKLYGQFFNKDEKIDFPKHRFRKFIKDVVFGTIERNEILIEELDKNLGKQLRFNKFDRRFDRCASMIRGGTPESEGSRYGLGVGGRDDGPLRLRDV